MSDRMRALRRVLLAICYAGRYMGPIWPPMYDLPEQHPEPQRKPPVPGYEPGAPLTAGERAAWRQLVGGLMSDTNGPGSAA